MIMSSKAVLELDCVRQSAYSLDSKNERDSRPIAPAYYSRCSWLQRSPPVLHCHLMSGIAGVAIGGKEGGRLSEQVD